VRAIVRIDRGGAAREVRALTARRAAGEHLDGVEVVVEELVEPELDRFR
jgi:hypothetical protein